VVRQTAYLLALMAYLLALMLVVRLGADLGGIRFGADLGGVAQSSLTKQQRGKNVNRQQP